MEHAVIAGVRSMEFGIKHAIFILRFAFFNFQREGTGWGRNKRTLGK